MNGADFFAWSVLCYGVYKLGRGLIQVMAISPRPAPAALAPEPDRSPAQPEMPAATAAPEPAPAPAPVAAVATPPPAPAPAPATVAPPPSRPRQAPPQVTWRTLALAPEGFDDAIRRGDHALACGRLTGAAVCYSSAVRRAGANRETGYRYFLTEAFLRLATLTGLCLCPPEGSRPAPVRERWIALHILASLGTLGDYQPAIARLGSMLYRVHRNRERLGPEGRAAWRILMACRTLSLPALEFLDRQLVDERLWHLRAELATHPSAGKDLWLTMLRHRRTPDLVHTIWEIEGAAEDQAVKAALTRG